MNKDFTESPSPEDPPCQFAGSLERLGGVGSVSPPRWMQAHLTECLSCLNDFARLQSLNFPPDPVRQLRSGGPSLTQDGVLHSVQELGAFMLEHKKFWLLPIVGIFVLFAGLIVATQGAAVVPFIYTLW